MRGYNVFELFPILPFKDVLKWNVIFLWSFSIMWASQVV